MKKQAGLWIDNRKAVIVLISGGMEEVKTIEYGVEKPVRFLSGSALGSSGDMHDHRFGYHLNSYYDQVIALVRSAETIQIFGPGDAKNELEKRLKNEGLKGRALSLETTDPMTESQITAKVRELFQL